MSWQIEFYVLDGDKKRHITRFAVGSPSKFFQSVHVYFTPQEITEDCIDDLSNRLTVQDPRQAELRLVKTVLRCAPDVTVYAEVT